MRPTQRCARRPSFGGAAATLALLVPLLACRMPPLPALRDYLPAHAGDIWCFDGEPGILRIESVTKVGDAERIRLTWRRPDGSLYRSEEIERRADGVLYVLSTGRDGQIELVPPQCISPPDTRPGFAVVSELETALPDGTSRPFNREWAVVGLETVETPAGTFPGCVHMRESLRDLSDQPLPEKITEWWFAPGVGWVFYRSVTAAGVDLPAIASDLTGARVGGSVIGVVPEM
ncbi:MAG: hypothetical protein AB1486_14045 [Planctomycetota bacterium]